MSKRFERLSANMEATVNGGDPPGACHRVPRLARVGRILKGHQAVAIPWNLDSLARSSCVEAPLERLDFLRNPAGESQGPTFRVRPRARFRILHPQFLIRESRIVDPESRS